MEKNLRRVNHGKIQMNGSTYHDGLLHRLHGKKVELKGGKDGDWHGYEIYYRNKLICFIKTHNYN